MASGHLALGCARKAAPDAQRRAEQPGLAFRGDLRPCLGCPRVRGGEMEERARLRARGRRDLPHPHGVRGPYVTPLPPPLGEKGIRFWRIDQARHAATWHIGEGAFLGGGRWNPPGIRGRLRLSRPDDRLPRGRGPQGVSSPRYDRSHPDIGPGSRSRGPPCRHPGRRSQSELAYAGRSEQESAGASADTSRASMARSSSHRRSPAPAGTSSSTPSRPKISTEWSTRDGSPSTRACKHSRDPHSPVRGSASTGVHVLQRFDAKVDPRR